MEETAIRLVNLTTGYFRGKTPLAVSEGMNASLKGASLTCFLGPNGAGKSTLLRTLCGFQPPLAGDIEILARPISGYEPVELAKLIAVVLTERTDVANMTAEELVATGRSPYTGFWGKLSPDDKEAVREALESVGASALSNRVVTTLSDGERQKVMIAKAIAQQTPIIFLDEPTAFLDFPSKVETMQFLHRLAHEKGKTVFMSTHDLELAIALADNLWLIDRKYGLTTGPSAELSSDGSIARYFERPGLRYDASSSRFIIAP